MFKVTWMAEDGEVSYSETDTPPAVGDIEEFDITVASYRQVVKVVDEQGTVPGAPAPELGPTEVPVVDDPALETADPAVEAQGDASPTPDPSFGPPAPPTPPTVGDGIPLATPENPAGQ